MNEKELQELAARDPEEFDRYCRRLKLEKADFWPMLGVGQSEINELFAAGVNDTKSAARHVIENAADAIKADCLKLSGVPEETISDILENVRLIKTTIGRGCFK